MNKRPRNFPTVSEDHKDSVIPAQAGIQRRLYDEVRMNWIPACAGMTGEAFVHKL